MISARPAVAPTPEIRRRMKRQRRGDTRPEIAVRKALHAAGVRFRIDVRLEPDLRVRGDIVWRRRKVVVFIDGCFWHRCPVHRTEPKNNAEWWDAKLTANVARDRRTDAVLRERGWTVLRYWEHEAPEDICAHIVRHLSGVRVPNQRDAGDRPSTDRRSVGGSARRVSGPS
jgi:DNA mismatch endonuclease, patch repair protein